MEIEELWEKSLKKTEILRSRLVSLLTFQETELPYIFLAESVLNIGDIVVREGNVLVHKPLILLPRDFPQFEGFDFKKDLKVEDEAVVNFLMMRGISFPSLKYSNQTYSLKVCRGPLKAVSERYSRKLQRSEDTTTGLILAPEDCWQFSILIYVATMVVRSAPHDIKKLLEDFRKKRGYD